MNGTVRDVSFTPDGHYLLSTGSELNIFACVLTQPVQLFAEILQCVVQKRCAHAQYGATRFTT